MNSLKLTLLLMSTFAFFLVSAQEKTITGKIIDAVGKPVSNASVKVKGKTGGVTTTNEGTFSITAAPGDVIEISTVGFQNHSVTVGAENVINITLEGAETTLQDIVLVGTRGSGRVKTESPVPVDVINIGQASLPTARMDVT